MPEFFAQKNCAFKCEIQVEAENKTYTPDRCLKCHSNCWSRETKKSAFKFDPNRRPSYTLVPILITSLPTKCRENCSQQKQRAKISTPNSETKSRNGITLQIRCHPVFFLSSFTATQVLVWGTQTPKSHQLQINRELRRQSNINFKWRICLVDHFNRTFGCYCPSSAKRH